MNVVVPEKISKIQVKSIGEKAFRYGCNKKNVKSAYLDKNILAIMLLKEKNIPKLLMK